MPVQPSGWQSWPGQIFLCPLCFNWRRCGICVAGRHDPALVRVHALTLSYHPAPTVHLCSHLARPVCQTGCACPTKRFFTVVPLCSVHICLQRTTCLTRTTSTKGDVKCHNCSSAVFSFTSMQQLGCVTAPACVHTATFDIANHVTSTITSPLEIGEESVSDLGTLLTSVI